MKNRKLGNTGETISPMGLGCMGMSYAYGHIDDQESIVTLHKALDIGITFWDTADVYANGKNEELIAKVLKPNRDKVFIATKFGFRSKDNKGGFSGSPGTFIDGSPDWIKTAVEQSLKRLNIETIDLYYAHRIDPNVPIEDTVGAMALLVKEGKVRYLGLSEAAPETIRKANAVHPIAALQTEYSVLSRDVEGEIMACIRELGISLVAYSPLARGLVSGLADMNNLPENDFRRTQPRYQGAYLTNNRQLMAEFAELANRKSCTPAQLALAWVLAQDGNIIPIPGTKKRKYLEENAGALQLSISTDDELTIETILDKYSNVGERYSKEAMKLINL